MADAYFTAGTILGEWRIVQLDDCDQATLDLDGEAFIELRPDGHGSFGFIVVTGDIDYRVEDQNQTPILRFSWAGFDERDPASGRGWIRQVSADRLDGHVYYHCGDDAAFTATRK